MKNILKTLNAKTVGAIATVSAAAVAVPARADFISEVKTAVETGFSNSTTVATAIVIGFAGIFAIKLVLRLIGK